MAARFLLSRAGGALRSLARSSSPGITVKGAPASAGPVAAQNFHAEARAASTRSALDRSRSAAKTEIAVGLAAGRGARRFHFMRDAIVEHADGAFAALSVVVCAGLVYASIDAYHQDEVQEGHNTETDVYRRTHELMEEVKREATAYSTSKLDEKAVLEEFMKEDAVMRARFDEWIKKHGRKYRDEVEKARRYKIFKAVAICSDAAKFEAKQAGHNTIFSPNELADWSAEELSKLCCAAPANDDDCAKMTKAMNEVTKLKKE